VLAEEVTEAYPEGVLPSDPLVIYSASPVSYEVSREDLPPLRLIRAAPPVRWVAGLLLALFPAALLALLVLPWQQTAPGEGEVIAFNPAEREQSVEAPVKGLIAQWFVQEGEVVEAGQPLVEIRDNDPEYLSRTLEERQRLDEQIDAAREKVSSYELKRQAEALSRDLAVAEYESKVLSLQQKVVSEQAELEANQINLQRVRALAEEGIESTRKLELAQLYAAKSQAALDAQLNVVQGAESARDKAREVGNGKVAAVEAELQEARAKLSELQAKRLKLDTRIARQEAQLVRAPAAGRVLTVRGGPGGTQVKPGDTLVTLVPDTEQRAVSFYVDGNDVPLIRPGDPARLVFEGWPALQFSGWPGASVGTFGGEVAFVDAAADGKGRFRVVVVPASADAPWPESDRLRQGARARGWVLLGRVSLGYELWRQINGFPPVMDVEKGDQGVPPNSKKPRAPKSLK
jgi:adhesin transport system membrane fusion protein